MHHYRSIRELNRTMPRMDDYRFHDALDVIEYPSDEGLFDWRTWTEIWHLDETGRFHCGSRLSSFDTIRRYVDDPEEIFEIRRYGLEQCGCPNRWLINEPRFGWMHTEPPGEADAEAFIRLRRILGDVGIDLVDCMLWSDDLRCWSLHELTGGTTRYATSRMPGRLP